jgi:Flp pilus assembly protein TadD
LLGALALSSGIGLVAVAIATYLTWPANTLGNYLRDRQNREANVRALTTRISAETDPHTRTFYQAWLAEEKGDLAGAIRGFQSVQQGTPPGTMLHLHGALRLGLVYGLNHEPERELATYQALMERHPGASRLSQATFYLRRGDRERARTLLDEALAQDARDGSLGTDRTFARSIRNALGPGPSGESTGPR